jgi:hypothetical protein
MESRYKTMMVPLGLSALILVVMGVIIAKDTRALMMRKEDTPPVIDFTWTPAGDVNLKEMRGFLTIKDDYAIDFTTYRFTIVEIGKTFDLPIDGLIGREYEQPVSLSLIADRPEVLRQQKLTVEVEVADDRGQKSTITRVIKLKR